MRRTILASIALLASGCSVVTGFGKYFADVDGGGMDAAVEGDGGAPCEPACAAGESCVSGMCQCGDGPACTDGRACCDGACASLDTLSHCGACGVACGPFASATSTCATGTCELTCVGGFADCDDDMDTGCEASLSSAATCGDCDTACESGEVCADDGTGAVACATDCPGTTTECGGTCIEDGGDCFCVAGAAPGAMTCTDDSASCVYPSEVCNALDDNCDGAADEGFDCVLGATLECEMIIAGCTARGTQTCNDSCAYGACVIAEACDRVDSDCDQLVDEEALVAGTSVTVVAATARAPRVAWSPDRNEVGVVYGEAPPGSATPVWFVRLDPTGAPLGAPLMVDGGSDWDIAWDGFAWAIGVVEGGVGTVVVHRVDAATGAVTGTSSVSTATGAIEVRLDRIGTSDELAVFWLEPNEVHVRTMSADATSHDTTSPDRTIETAGAPAFASAAAVRGGATCLVAWYDRRTGGRIEVRGIMPGGNYFDLPDAISDDGQPDSQVELAFDPSDGTILIAYEEGGRLKGTSLLATGGNIAIDETDIGPAGASIGLAYANDGTFGVVALQSSDPTPVVRRLRGSDLLVFDTIPLSGAGIQGVFLAGIGGSGPARYLTGTFVGSGTEARPIVCR